MKLKNNNGFTLAEVLMVLAIIGVLAAMTIPTLLQRSQEKATVSRLKKVYSTLSTAYRSAIYDNGSPAGDWASDAPGVLANYLKISKNCLKESCDSQRRLTLDNKLFAEQGVNFILSDG